MSTIQLDHLLSTPHEHLFARRWVRGAAAPAFAVDLEGQVLASNAAWEQFAAAQYEEGAPDGVVRQLMQLGPRALADWSRCASLPSGSTQLLVPDAQMPALQLLVCRVDDESAGPALLFLLDSGGPVAPTQEERILDVILDNAPIGIAIARAADKELLVVSRAGVAMVGLHPQEGTRWDAWQLYHLDGTTPAKPQELPLYRACDGESVDAEKWLLRVADGRLLPMRAHAAPVSGPLGTVTHGIVVWYDISAFEEAERVTLQAISAEHAARLDAETAVRQKDEFVAMVSHELRTPMGVIASAAAVLQSPKVTVPQRERALAVIERNVHALARMVDDLLDMSRVRSRRLQIERRRMELGAAADAAVQALQPLASQHGVRLNSRVCAAQVWGEAVRCSRSSPTCSPTP